MNRFRFITFGIYPELLPYPIYSECRRMKRNVASLRASLLKIMEARRSGEVQGDIDGDLLSIILSDDLYRNDLEKTLDELTILFVAGNETVKIALTNTVCYLAQNPKMKQKLLD